ncbi:hypothetical protein ACP275_13G188400 [Erythranthe tilingii]
MWPLQHMIDVPIHGRILTLELFRRHGEARDLLFVATERYTFCVLQWDAETSDVITRVTGDAWHPERSPTHNIKVGTVDPDGRLIVFHISNGTLKVFPFTNAGQLGEPFNIRVIQGHILDIKFLHGCGKPTVVMLYKTMFIKNWRFEVHAITVDSVTKIFCVAGRGWLTQDLHVGPHLMITVPEPLCGVLLFCKKVICYRGPGGQQTITKEPTTISACGRVDLIRARYVYGDHNGNLLTLDIAHEGKKPTGLKIVRLDKTSVASSISYIGASVVFVGSSYGDSQLVKINIPADEIVPRVEVLKIFENLGPIADFCVVDSERQGQCQLVTCSGAYKDGSLRILSYGIGINEQASRVLQVVTGMWSLRSSTDDPYSTFLVVSFISGTRIWEMNLENDLKECQIQGFSSDVETLFCHDAIHDQLVQVTSNAVRLVSSTTRELCGSWVVPADCSIIVATANVSQVLLATRGLSLIYLKIGDGVLTEVVNIQLECDISCLDINPIGNNSHYSDLAAVGMWGGIGVRIYSLPDFIVLTTDDLGQAIPRSVLMCSLDGVSYLLCALGDGHLFNFVLNTVNGDLADKKQVSLGTRPITLRTFSSKGAIRVFAASTRSTVICRRYRKLCYSNVNLKEVIHMCPFSSAAFPESVAIATREKLIIGGIDDIQKLHSSILPLGESADFICHQERTKTIAVCNLKDKQSNAEGSEDSGRLSISLLDDQTFKELSTFCLRQFERCCCIISCSLSDDKKEYYCIGTAYKRDKEEATGRVLLLSVGVEDKDRILVLIASAETCGDVREVEAFNGKLLASLFHETVCYEWLSESRMLCPSSYSDDRVINIYVGGSIFEIFSKGEEDPIEREEGSVESEVEVVPEQWEKCSHEIERVKCYFTSVDNDNYMGCDDSFNIFTFRVNENMDAGGGTFKLVGVYHLGERINRFRKGTMGFPVIDGVDDVERIPAVMFGTSNGVIGLVASLPEDEYLFWEMLQTNMRKMIKVAGGVSHVQWRSFYNEKRTVAARNFLDGDLIKLFLNLSLDQKEKISKAVGVAVEALMERVEELPSLH